MKRKLCLIAAVLLCCWVLPAQAAAKSAPSGGSFYRKLREGAPVRIAVLGDSIACGTGADPGCSWDALLKGWLDASFASEVTMDNYAVGGTDSYLGYVLCEMLMRPEIERSGAYDLVIVCYGHNDGEGNLRATYTGLLHRVRELNPQARLIAVLESSQKTYTEKIKTIQELAAQYGADTADAVGAMKRSGLTFAQFSPDGTHPGNEGHQVYFETIRDIFLENLASKRENPMPALPESDIAPLFEGFRFTPLSECIHEDGSWYYTADGPTLGMLFQCGPGSGDLRVHLDGAVWEGSGRVDKTGYWLSAAPLMFYVPKGTLVALEDPEGLMESTVLGFVESGRQSTEEIAQEPCAG